MIEIVAEISCNHLKNFERAQKLVRECCCAGADAVKLQVWHPTHMVGPNTHVITGGPWAGRELADLYAEAYTPWTWIETLFDIIKSYGVKPFASVFDRNALSFLERIGCTRYKIASFELVDLPLIAAVARTGKPMIMSTGMATTDEIAEAVATARMADCADLTLLKCTSAYPADPGSMNLQEIQRMKYRHGCEIGLSDHSQGIGVAVAAAALGAVMIEKHVTLKRADGGPDAEFSLEPHELDQLVKECHRAAAAAGDPVPSTEDEAPQRALRRSLYWAKDLPAGHVVTTDDVFSARPALGLPPGDIHRIVGHGLMADVKERTPVSLPL